MGSSAHQSMWVILFQPILIQLKESYNFSETISFFTIFKKLSKCCSNNPRPCSAYYTEKLLMQLPFVRKRDGTSKEPTHHHTLTF